jgi:hypothetical protein
VLSSAMWSHISRMSSVASGRRVTRDIAVYAALRARLARAWRFASSALQALLGARPCAPYAARASRC